MMSGRGVKDFLGKPAPPGYVAGLGRGATGFVTRPDLGPGSLLAATASCPTPPLSNAQQVEEDIMDEYENEEGLLAVRGPLGADDEEADKTFSMVEAKMNERRKGRKQIRESIRKDNDPTTLFAKEKLQLRQVSPTEWAKLPESGDFIAKRVKKSNEKERFTPVPDSVLFGGGLLLSNDTEKQMMVAASGSKTDFRSIGEARERVLGARLDMTTPDMGKATSVDPVGYLTSLEGSAKTGTEVNEIRRARLLLKSVVKSNPQNASAWISAAKIEEVAKDMKQARSIINDAIENCPDSEDVWLEAIRLAATPVDRNAIAIRAVKTIPKSPKLWLKIAELEKDKNLAKKHLRNGLEENPESAMLWKTLIEGEEDAEDARVLLAKAVDCCPHDVELWIGLARLEVHSEARKVLNKARQLNPMSVEVWIAAARLEEANGNQNGIVNKIISRTLDELSRHGVTLTRKDWIRKALECEDTRDVVCAQSIIKATCTLGLDEKDDDDRLSTWIDEANTNAQSHPIVARTLLDVAIEKHPHHDLPWLKLFGLPLDVSPDDYEKAISNCPHSVDVWCQYASFIRIESENDAMAVIERALELNESSEQLWLQLVQYKLRLKDIVGALTVLERARKVVGSEKIWIKSAKLMMRVKDADTILDEALSTFPNSEKLWLLRGASRPNDFKWDFAFAACPKAAKLYILASEQLLKQNNYMQARATLERARRLLPDHEEVWLASIRLEIKLDATSQARNLLNRSLQVCSWSGSLWYEAIMMESRPTRKSKIIEALRRCGSHPLLYLSLAQLMELERNHSSAKEYYEKAVQSDKNCGDAWAYFIIFIRRYHSAEEAQQLMKHCTKDVKPKDGLLWKPFRKQGKWWEQDYETIFETFVNSLIDQSKG